MKWGKVVKDNLFYRDLRRNLESLRRKNCIKIWFKARRARKDSNFQLSEP